jgi:beta-lactamase class D
MPAIYRSCFVILFAILSVGYAGGQAQPSLTPTPTVSSQPVSTAAATPPSEAKPELKRYFGGYEGAFVLYDLNSNRYIRYNPARCAERFIPASTFKIMNSLIGLETGVIPDENYVIQWDGTSYPILSWNQDHTLKTAIQNSVVWYYQELARRVGRERMQRFVGAANYGNKDISGQIDSFWLEGGLRISPDEQVAFLKRLYQGDLPFSQRTMAIVRTILVMEKTETYQLGGKTGSVQRVTPHQSWYVGYLETQGNVYFFATDFESADADGMANGEMARKINRTILQSLGLLQQ